MFFPFLLTACLPAGTSVRYQFTRHLLTIVYHVIRSSAVMYQNGDKQCTVGLVIRRRLYSCAGSQRCTCLFPSSIDSCLDGVNFFLPLVPSRHDTSAHLSFPGGQTGPGRVVRMRSTDEHSLVRAVYQEQRHQELSTGPDSLSNIPTAKGINHSETFRPRPGLRPRKKKGPFAF